MKIGFVLDDSLDKADGVQQYILTLGRWLNDQGHEVHYLAGETKRRDVPRVHSLCRNIVVNFNGNQMSTPWPAPRHKLRKLLADEKFDVLHVQMPYSPWMAGRIVRAAGKDTAIVGTFHILPYSWRERLATFSLGFLLGRTLRRFDSVLSVSQPAQVFARQSFRLHSQVLPNVVDLKRFARGEPIKKYQDGKLNIVFLGRLVARKGCMELLRAIQQLHYRHRLQNVRVIIAGDGPLRQQLEQYVSDNHLSRYVHFTGFLREIDKPRLLATADIAVFPSLGGESFGIVLLEAMAAKAKVVLAGDNPGYRSVIGQRSAQLVAPHSPASFSKSLHHFIVSSRARQRAFRWQQQTIGQYDVARVGPQLMEIYTQTLQSRRSVP